MLALDTTEQTIVYVIDEFHAGDDFRSVEVIVAGFCFDVNATVELINAAPKMYDALNDAIAFVCQSVPPAERTPETDALILNMQRAEVSARGGILQRDRMVSHA